MTAIVEALRLAGGPSRLARELGVSAQAVCFWRDGKRRLPPEACAGIERTTDGMIACEALRPDLRWLRIADASWRWHEDGRPLVEVTQVAIVGDVSAAPDEGAKDAT